MDLISIPRFKELNKKKYCDANESDWNVVEKPIPLLYATVW